MTIRDLYLYAQVEMNKIEAPSLILEEYNYLMNKAVQQYINKVYNRYDINQQASDDLRVLKATAEVTLTKKSYNRIDVLDTFDFRDSEWQNAVVNSSINKTVENLHVQGIRISKNSKGLKVNDSDDEPMDIIIDNTSGLYKKCRLYFIAYDTLPPSQRVTVFANGTSTTLYIDNSEDIQYVDIDLNDYQYAINVISEHDPTATIICTKLELTQKAKPRRVANKDKFIYEGVLPKDYVHILNCFVDYQVLKDFKCYRKGDYIEFGAKRYTADLGPAILHNVYMKPDYMRPYFYIHNNNTSVNADLTPSNEGNMGKWNSTNVGIDSGYINSIDRDSINPDGNRTANTSDVRIEIRFGDDDRIFKPEYLYIDYIKAPMFIELTYDDITSTEDTTRVLEFPDYVCYEIVNEFVKLLMENNSDPRLQTHFAVNQTIADPTASQSQSGDKS